MIKSTGKIRMYVLSIALILVAVNVVYSQVTTEQAAVPVPDYDQEAVLRQERSYRFLERLRNEIRYNEDELARISVNVADKNAKLKSTRSEIASLENELARLDEDMDNVTAQIENVKQQLASKTAEITNLEFEIEQKKVNISYQKQLLKEYLISLYVDQNKLSSLKNEEPQLNTLKLLMGDEPAGSMLVNLEYAEILENQGREMFEQVTLAMEEEELQKKLLYLKKTSLEKLKLNLFDREKELEDLKVTKNLILEQTKGQESVYLDILKEFKEQQEAVAKDLDIMKKNLEFVKRKMSELGSNFNPSEFSGLLEGLSQKDLLEYLKDSRSGDFQPIWPVAPHRGISAYFQDKSYLSYFGFAHNAIDIPASQETPIRAAADGFVYKAKDNGLGYSYIVLLHKKGYMTTYGHVYQILVSPGDYVEAGDVIGLVGGKPGTKGAGVYTTGPHLHFEISKDGNFVDPLFYVNLAYLNLENIPDKYLVKAMDDRNKVRRKAEESDKKVKRATSANQTAESDSKLILTDSFEESAQ